MSQKCKPAKISNKGQVKGSFGGVQKGGAYWESSNAVFVSPAQLSKYTLKYIDKAPMFNPLAQCGTIIPTGTSGITPNGAYLATHPNHNIKGRDFTSDANPLLGSPSCPVGVIQQGGAYDSTFYSPGRYVKFISNDGTCACGKTNDGIAHYS